MLHLLILAPVVLAVVHRLRYYRAARQRMEAQSRFYFRIADELGRMADQLEEEEEKKHRRRDESTG